MVMLSLPRIFDDAPHLTPPSWCPAEGAVLVDPGGDRSGMVWLCVLSSHGESWAKYNLVEPIPLQVEHVAVEFVEPFRPSGPCLRTMKTFTQRCRVGTSYFTHSWETREGRERLPSRKGPKDQPTADSTS